MWQTLLQELEAGEVKSLARSISHVENETAGYGELMKSLPSNLQTPVIGVTGPPGAGKSTLVDSLIGGLVLEGERVGVLCVDPSSPFNLGAVLGDRIRMSEWYNHPDVFIRSLATRGALGGLHPKIIEITDLLKAAAYDTIIVETVGVGQSEVEIAGLADTTIVVLVPEAGDEIQTMKAGLMEIADIFVVNKSDRPGADMFVKNLNMMLSPAFKKERKIPIIKTVAHERQGVHELIGAVKSLHSTEKNDEKKLWLLAEQAFHLIQARKMDGIQKNQLKKMIEALIRKENFNLYRFVEECAQ